jgi:hypothetical protein
MFGADEHGGIGRVGGRVVIIAGGVPDRVAETLGRGALGAAGVMMLIGAAAVAVLTAVVGVFGAPGRR